MGTIAIVISYTVITSYQFKGGGDILHLIFPDSISRDQGMCIIAAFVIVFTAAAGMASIAYLDLVIGALVTVIVIIAVPLVLQKAGGWQHVTEPCFPPRISKCSAILTLSASVWFDDSHDAAFGRQSGHVSEVFFRPIGTRRQVCGLRMDCGDAACLKRCW